MAPLSPGVMEAVISLSDLVADFGQAVDRESARVMLAVRLA
jgi:hypothetical protein